jgi:hypothetical protein
MSRVIAHRSAALIRRPSLSLSYDPRRLRALDVTLRQVASFEVDPYPAVRCASRRPEARSRVPNRANRASPVERMPKRSNARRRLSAAIAGEPRFGIKSAAGSKPCRDMRGASVRPRHALSPTPGSAARIREMRAPGRVGLSVWLFAFAGLLARPPQPRSRARRPLPAGPRPGAPCLDLFAPVASRAVGTPQAATLAP